MNVFGRENPAEGRLSLRRDSAAAGRARKFVERVLAQRGASPGAVEAAQLVASELVTNALQHGEGAITLQLKHIKDFLRIEVIDEGRDQAPAVRAEPPDQTGGWGLRIVDQLAVQWGVFEGTTHVWADVKLA